MLHDSFFKDIENLFAQMEQEFDLMEQSMFMQWPVQEFEVIFEAEDFPADLPKPDLPQSNEKNQPVDFPRNSSSKKDFSSTEINHQETLANQNFSKTMKKIPYEGPDQNN